jgi:N-acyl-D-aspartate/D-glutamate deacylase
VLTGGAHTTWDWLTTYRERQLQARFRPKALAVVSPYRAELTRANRLGLFDRGRIQVGAKADLVLFDPQTITDHATYQQPHQLSSGILQVWVNGQQVIHSGRHTGATPGQIVRGPGYLARSDTG